ncbi:hypothetical protein NBO_364g0019 [Nosema bombycis CQ1]|uniref:Uncharacterized protein n=1 Tax=Nosema bombycis (strain CQ1 / CVCC 102059) TaxID=578461 RepID=R0MJ53_NOSB1|nr:hypothetical protein NBO_364g0019 [Nosema bombycis CQ1]|eukprot:EOB12813.1 hypothetical protein NBO_364g0019 [Nosema bombycis CQ1]
MSDLFRKVKNIFTNLKSFIISSTEKEKSPYDQLVERFSSDKPLEVNELDFIKDLCKKITVEEGQSLVDERFSILKDLMFEKVVDSSFKSKVVVNDKKIKDRKDYKEFIRREYKRMIHDEPEEKKEVKRVKKNIKRYKNDVNWGILPKNWRIIRESAPLDVVEFAFNNDDEYKGPIVFLGEVPSEEEEAYFTEDYINELNSKIKSKDIICDLYNPETNCRNCIKYEYNQEKIKNVLEEIEKEKESEEDLIENLKKRFGPDKETTEKFIKKTSNLEEKVWLSFLFNKKFKFSNLSDKEKNAFFLKLKSSGVLCMDALEKGNESEVNTKTKAFGRKRELFNIKDNVILTEGSILKPDLNSEENDLNSSPFEREDHVKSFKYSESKEDQFSISVESYNSVEKPETEENIKLAMEKKSEDNLKSEEKQPFKDIGFKLPPLPLFNLDKEQGVTKEDGEDTGKPKELKTNLFSLPKINLLNEPETKEVKTKDLENPIKIPESWHYFPKYPLQTNTDPSINAPVKNETHPPVFSHLTKQKTSPKEEEEKLGPLQNREETKLGPLIPKSEDNVKTPTNPFSFTPSGTPFQMPYKTESTPFSLFPSVSLLPKTETNPPSGTPFQMPIKTETYPPSGTPFKMPLKTESNPSTSTPFRMPLKTETNPPSGTPFQMPLNIGSNPPSAPFTTPFQSTAFPSNTPPGPAKRKIDKFAPSPFIDPSSAKRFNSPPPTFNTGPSMLQMPNIENNPELKKIIEINTNNIPFLGTVPNPFETANPVQHSTDSNLNFVDNTFKYSDIFDKTNPNLFLNTKSMFDDIIFDNNGKKEDEESNVKYLKKNNDGGSSLFGSNMFGNDNDPWNK